MKRLFFAFGVSAWLHLLLLLFFVFYKFPIVAPIREVQMDFMASEQTLEPTHISPRIQPTLKQSDSQLPRTAPNSNPASVVVAPLDSVINSPENRLSVLKLQLNNPQFLIKAYASKQNYDSILIALQSKKHWQPGTDQNNLARLVPFKQYDPIADYMRQKNIGQAPLANFLPLMMAAKAQKPPPKSSPRLEAIPTRVQLHALSVIWQSNRATLPEIYASMDSSYAITAQILEQILQDMFEKNLLERKKISPSNEFTLLGPFLEHGIEMSALNRKNPVYEYSARIKREDVIRFLQAKLYLLTEKMQAEPDSFTQKAAADIMDKIQQILTAAADSQ